MPDRSGGEPISPGRYPSGGSSEYRGAIDVYKEADKVDAIIADSARIMEGATQTVMSHRVNPMVDRSEAVAAISEAKEAAERALSALNSLLETGAVEESTPLPEADKGADRERPESEEDYEGYGEEDH